MGIFIHEQIKHLQNSGCTVNVVSPIPYVPRLLRFKKKWKPYIDLPFRTTYDSVSVYYPRYIRLPGSWFHGFSCYFMYWAIKGLIRKIMKELNPDIIHAHQATIAGYTGLMLKRKFNIPLVCSLRGSDINSYPKRGWLAGHLTKKLVSGADQLLSVSHALKSAAMKIAKPKREIQVVYNGCDLSTFCFGIDHRTRKREELQIQKDEITLVFVGSIEKEKGIIELINSFKDIISVHPDTHLIFVGDGPLSSTLHQIISNSKFGSNVHIVGKKSHDEISEYLCCADMLVLPSYNEGLPNVVLEAMACGTPVLATSVGGIPEVVDNKTGVLIPAKSSEAITKGVGQMLEKKWNRDEIRKHVDKFCWNRNAEITINNYKKLIIRNDYL